MPSAHLVREIAVWLIITGSAGTGALGAALAMHPRFRPRGRHRTAPPPGPDQPAGPETMERLIAADEAGEWAPEPSGPLARWAGKLRSEIRLIPIGGPKR